MHTVLSSNIAALYRIYAWPFFKLLGQEDVKSNKADHKLHTDHSALESPWRIRKYQIPFNIAVYRELSHIDL